MTVNRCTYRVSEILTFAVAVSVFITATAVAQKPNEPYFVAKKDIEYARPNNQSLRLDLYLPRSGQGPYPLIIRIHGGGWRTGSKDSDQGIALVKFGFALASIDYRLTDKAVFPAQLHDCKAAVRFLRANAAALHINPDRIGVWGMSAGGHLAALLGTTGGISELEGTLGNNAVSSRVQAVFDVCGPANLLNLPPPYKGTRHETIVADLLGGPVSENQDAARAASPISYATPDDPPFLIFHGTKDNLVPIEQSRELAKVLAGAGVNVTLIEVPNAEHNVMDTVRKVPAYAIMPVEFFSKYLK